MPGNSKPYNCSSCSRRSTVCATARITTKCTPTAKSYGSNRIMHKHKSEQNDCRDRALSTPDALRTTSQTRRSSCSGGTQANRLSINGSAYIRAVMPRRSRCWYKSGSSYHHQQQPKCQQLTVSRGSSLANNTRWMGARDVATTVSRHLSTRAQPFSTP